MCRTRRLTKRFSRSLSAEAWQETQMSFRKQGMSSALTLSLSRIASQETAKSTLRTWFSTRTLHQGSSKRDLCCSQQIMRRKISSSKKVIVRSLRSSFCRTTRKAQACLMTIMIHSQTRKETTQYARRTNAREQTTKSQR